MAVLVKEFQDELNRTNRVLHEFFKEGDRAAAVLVGSEIDRAILGIIEAHLLSSSEFSSPLLERGGPLEAFAVRIELIYRLGLIPPVMHHDLQVLRKIRNEFAHGSRGLDFDQSPVRELASRLVMGHREMQEVLSKLEKPAAASAKPFEPRNIFRLSASMLLPHLCVLRFQIPKIEPHWPRFFRDPRSSVEKPDSNDSHRKSAAETGEPKA